MDQVCINLKQDTFHQSLVNNKPITRENVVFYVTIFNKISNLYYGGKTIS